MPKKKLVEKEEVKPVKYIIGLDLSLTATGWSKYDVEKKELTSGVIASTNKGMARLNDIVSGVCSQLTKEPTKVYIENYGFGSKGRVVEQGELGGIIRFYLWKLGVEYVEVPPTRCKKFLTGKGVAEKSLILKELYKKYKIDVDDDNEADAIVLNLIGQAKHKIIEVTKTQEEVIKEIN